MKDLLFISLSVPPKSGAESLQAYRYLKYLNESELNITVLTSSPNKRGWQAVDSSLQDVINQISSYVCLKCEASLFNKVCSKLGLCKRKGEEELFVSQFPRVLNRLKRPDIIYSRSAPIASHLMAMKLVDAYKVPWVAHFSDPYWGNPYEEQLNTDFAKQTEMEIINRADRISFTSQGTLDIYRERYPRLSKKLVHFPNVYDDALVVNQPDENLERPLHIIHTGNFYEKRNPHFFLEGLRELATEDSELLKELKVTFVGHNDEFSKNVMFEFEDLRLDVRGSLSFGEALQLQRQSHILLLIDKGPEVPMDNVFLPSKIMDYMACGKPILAISSPESESTKLISQGYGYCVPHGNNIQLKRTLKEIIGHFRKKDLKFFKGKEPDEMFSARNNVTKFLELLETL